MPAWRRARGRKVAPGISYTLSYIRFPPHPAFYCRRRAALGSVHPRFLISLARTGCMASLASPSPPDGDAELRRRAEESEGEDGVTSVAHVPVQSLQSSTLYTVPGSVQFLPKHLLARAGSKGPRRRMVLRNRDQLKGMGYALQVSFPCPCALRASCVGAKSGPGQHK